MNADSDVSAENNYVQNKYITEAASHQIRMKISVFGCESLLSFESQYDLRRAAIFYQRNGYIKGRTNI